MFNFFKRKENYQKSYTAIQHFDNVKFSYGKDLVPIKKFHSASQGLVFPNGFINDEFSRRIVTPQRALFYYDVVAPLATAVDIINDEFKTLQLAVKTNGDITTDDEILKFLNQPNDDMTLVDFLETMGIYFLVTNEVYIIATGNLNLPPAELLLASPEIVEVRKGRDGFIDRIEVQRTTSSKEVFTRNPLEFRFFNRDETAEIWQIKGFNTRFTGRGKSKLSSVQYELDQYIEAATHNLNLLRKGLRSSGAFSTDEQLADDQFERLREQLESFYSGSANAGNSMVLDNGLEFKEMSINPKDMDFANLKKDFTTTIFNRYKIPLPLVNLDKTTLANMGNAKLNLYDNAVLPFATRMFCELTRFIGPRFNMDENQDIVPFMDSITALQTRRNEELNRKNDLNVLTINELRTEIGEEEIAEGGDIVYIPDNVVPAGSSASDGENTDNDTTNTENDATKTTRERFTQILESQLDVKGNRTYTDEEIKHFADEQDL